MLTCQVFAGSVTIDDYKNQTFTVAGGYTPRPEGTNMQYEVQTRTFSYIRTYMHKGTTKHNNKSYTKSLQAIEQVNPYLEGTETSPS